MSKKGRRTKRNKAVAKAPVSPAAEDVVIAKSPSAEAELDGPTVVESAGALADDAATEVTPSPSNAWVEAADSEPPPRRTEYDDGNDSSYPPVDMDARFFEAEHPSADPFADHEDGDSRIALKLTPEVARRRADLQKYVKVAVAAASVLCVAALVKVGIARGHSAEEARGPVAVAAAEAPVTEEPMRTSPAVAPASPPPAATQELSKPASPPPAEAVAVAEPPAAPPAPVVAAAAAAPAEAASPAPEATPPAEPDPKEAAKAKHASQAALEWGKTAAAIEAGERSVALDPTDAEAWLILGASYQAKGDMKNARRSYKACLEQGKRGPKNECAAMPH